MDVLQAVFHLLNLYQMSSDSGFFQADIMKVCLFVFFKLITTQYEKDTVNVADNEFTCHINRRSHPGFSKLCKRMKKMLVVNEGPLFCSDLNR